MTFSPICLDQRSCAYRRILFRRAGFAALIVFQAVRLSAQSGNPSAQAPPEQQPASTTKKDATSPSKPPAKPKKVYTNEDLETHSDSVDLSSSTDKGETEYFGALLTCAADCEQHARMGVSLGHDGVSDDVAWQEGIARARSRLAADIEWHEELRKMVELMRIYCNYLNPQTAKGSPGAKSFDANTAYQAQEYIRKTGRTLDDSYLLQYQKLHNMMNKVKESDPETGELMDVERNRADKCSNYIPQ